MIKKKQAHSEVLTARSCKALSTLHSSSWTLHPKSQADNN